MRETQFIGLNGYAKMFIENHIKLGGVELMEWVTGMFDEPVWQIRRFMDKESGKKFEEYIQAEPWSSGPCIFLALRWVDTNEIITQTLWSDEEINNA